MFIILNIYCNYQIDYLGGLGLPRLDWFGFNLSLHGIEKTPINLIPYGHLFYSIDICIFGLIIVLVELAGTYSSNAQNP